MCCPTLALDGKYQPNTNLARAYTAEATEWLSSTTGTDCRPCRPLFSGSSDNDNYVLCMNGLDVGARQQFAKEPVLKS